MRTPTRMKFKCKLKFLTLCLTAILLSGFSVSAQKPKTVAPPAKQTRVITVTTEPKAGVWLDDVLWGATDESGKITIKNVSAGKHVLRVRADGFKEVSQNLLPTQTGEVKISLVKTTDEAELAFQQAEKSTSSKQKAKELYEKAIRLRPKFPEAYLGLARVYLAESDADGALEAIKNARKARPIYPEASAVEGRVYQLDEEAGEKALASFRRAIKEGNGFQPEAYTGLALFYQEKAEAAGGEGDFEGEQAQYAQAVKYFAPAIKQLAGAPDAIVVYQLYGLIYEKMKKYNEAIGVYEEFLRVFPDADEASVVRSFIVQLKKQMSEPN